MLDHVLDASLELSNHEDDKVDEQDLPYDRNVEEGDESQKEGNEKVSGEQVPVFASSRRFSTVSLSFFL